MNKNKEEGEEFLGLLISFIKSQIFNSSFIFKRLIIVFNYLLYSFSADKGSLHDSSTTQHSPTSLFGGKGTNIIYKCICDK